MAKQRRVARFGGTPLEAAFYSTDNLISANGRVPEVVSVRQLSATLEENGIDHVIHYGLGATPNWESLGSGCDKPRGLTEFGEWLFTTGQPEIIAADVNLLLMNTNSGGCSFVKGKSGTAPAGNIDHDPGEVVKRGGVNDRWADNVSAVLHEVGRQIGVGFGKTGDTEGHPGWGWNDHFQAAWHRTPNNNGNDQLNACGEYVEPRQYDDKISELYFHPCTYEHWVLEDKPALPECENDGHCPSGQICVNGSCVDEPTQPECTTDTDCPAGFICQNGSCVEDPQDGGEEPPERGGVGPLLGLALAGAAAYAYMNRD